MLRVLLKSGGPSESDGETTGCKQIEQMRNR